MLRGSGGQTAGPTYKPAPPPAPAPTRVSALTPQPAYVKPATTQQRTAATHTYTRAFGKPSGGYKGAVVHVFKSQPKPVQAKILKGALQKSTAESKILLDYLRGHSYTPPSLSALRGLSLPGRVSGLTQIANRLGYDDFALHLQRSYPELKSLGSDLSFRLMRADAKPVDAAVIAETLGGYQKLALPSGIAHMAKVQQGKAIEPHPSDHVISGSGLSLTPEAVKGLTPVAANQGGVAGALHGELITRAAKDAATLASSLPTTVATLGSEAAHLQFGKIGKQFGQGIAQTVEHPLQHPLYTALMFTGGGGGVARLAAAPVRALAKEGSLAGRIVSTARPGIALTGKLTHERAPFSKSPLIKGGQVLFDKRVYKRAPTGELRPKSGPTGDWLHRRLTNLETGHVVGPRERIRRANLDIVRHEGQKAIRPSLVARGAKNARNIAAYDPKAPVLRGADALPLIADGTIRRVGTFEKDLRLHRDEIAKNRPNLMNDAAALKHHDDVVARLTAMLNDKKLLANPKPLFDAVETGAFHDPTLEPIAHKFGHYGATMTQDGLLKRALSHYAVRHMGADMKLDPAEVAAFDRATAAARAAHPDWPAATIRSHVARKVAEPIEHLMLNGKQLSTATIREHLKGPEGTGGRMPFYTSDKVAFKAEKAARQSGYISQERLPTPVTKRTRLYAYTHGLTRLGPEPLIENRMRMQQTADAYRAGNKYAETFGTKLPEEYRTSRNLAQRFINERGIRGYVPFNFAPGHPAGSLDAALHEADPAEFETSMLHHQFAPFAENSPNLVEGPGRWGIIHEDALKALRAHQKQISPDTVGRSFRGLNTQFRLVALSTSPKHVPGVAQEVAIRAVGNGIGFRSWAGGRRLAKVREEIAPVAGREANIAQTGGMAAGMTLAHRVYTVGDHWQGTAVYPPLKAIEATFKLPVAHNIRTAWRTWTDFVVKGTKRALEEQSQTAARGKFALMEHGYAEAARVDGMMGLIHRALGLHGKMLEDAARGVFDQKKLAQETAYIRQIMGRWTDLTPAGQTGLMLSPFGLWWVNSARFLMRMPRDMPVKTGALGTASLGTQQLRQQQGLQPFTPGALPSYEQGGYPIGGNKVLAQQYYSPFGIAGDPMATGQSLLEPWLTPIVLAAVPGHLNWLGQPLSAPGLKKGQTASGLQAAQYILDSAMSSFVPFYQKAKQVTEGGSSPYDVTDNKLLPPLLRGKAPATKKPGHGIRAGLVKATFPFREYRKPKPKDSGAGWGGSSGWGDSSSGGGWGGGSSSGWGGSSGSSGSSSGWG